MVAKSLLSLLPLAFFRVANGRQESSGSDEQRFAFMVHDFGNPFWATQAKGAGWGMYRASVSMALYESGRSELEILYKLVNGEAVEPHQKIVNEAITIDNVDKYLQ
jgi:hypothetical protein